MKILFEIMRQNFLLATIIKMSIIVVLCILINYIIDETAKFFYEKLKNTKHTIIDVLIITIRKPIRILVWLGGIICCFKLIETRIGFNLYNFVYKSKSIIIIYCICLFIRNFTNKYTERFIKRKKENKEKVDYGLVEFTRKIILIVLLTMVFIYGLDFFGINVKGLMALGGIGGIAIGFASKDLLSNLFGGLSIFLDKPFTVGDWIASPDKNIEGVVEKIGWRETKILTFSNYPIYLPNFIFSGIIIENKGRMNSRLVNEIFSIKFDDYSKVDKVTAEINNMLEESNEIDKTSIKTVSLYKINDNTLDILVYVFLKDTDFEKYSKNKEKILIKILEIFDNNEIKLANRIFLKTQN